MSPLFQTANTGRIPPVPEMENSLGAMRKAGSILPVLVYQWTVCTGDTQTETGGPARLPTHLPRLMGESIR
jgi:hypothetical protein